MNSPQDLAVLRVEVIAKGSRLDVTDRLVSISILHAINRIPEAELRLMDGDVASQAFPASESSNLIPGADIQVRLGRGDSATAIFDGVVVSQTIEIEHDEGPTLVVHCRHKAMRMAAARRSEVYENANLRDITSKWGVDVSGSGPVETQAVQAFATDWDFLVSSAEAIGQVVVCSSQRTAVTPPLCQSADDMPVAFGRDILAFRASLDASEHWGDVQATGWDPDGLTLVQASAEVVKVAATGNLKDSDLDGVAAPHTDHCVSAAPLPVEQLEAWASARRLRSRLARLQGSVRIDGNTRHQPNTWVRLEGLGQRFNGPAYVSGVEHVVEEGTWHTILTLGLSARPFVEQVDATAQPAASLLPAIHGLYNGIVRQIIEDPDAQLRILVAVPALGATDGKGELWARWSQPYASRDVGMFFAPEVGDEVVLGFLHGDPRFPVVLGSLYGSQRKSPLPLADKNPRKGIVTASHLQVLFDDDKKIVSILTPAGNSFVLDDDAKKVVLTDQNNNRVELSGDGILVKSGGKITLEAASSITLKATDVMINATEQATLKGTSQVQVAGAKVTLQADMELQASGGASAKLSAGGEIALNAALIRLN